MTIYKEYSILETIFWQTLYLPKERLNELNDATITGIRVQSCNPGTFQIVGTKLADSDDLEYLLKPKGRGIHICFTIHEIDETEVVVKESKEATQGMILHIPLESIHEYTTNLINNGDLHVGTIITFNEADNLLMFYSKY